MPMCPSRQTSEDGKTLNTAPAGPEHAMDLPQHAVQVVHVLHHLVVDHQVEMIVGKRNRSATPGGADRIPEQASLPGFLARVRASVKHVRSEDLETGRAAFGHQLTAAAPVIEHPPAMAPGPIEDEAIRHVHGSSSR